MDDSINACVEGYDYYGGGDKGAVGFGAMQVSTAITQLEGSLPKVLRRCT